jgi:hypothetical protein
LTGTNLYVIICVRGVTLTGERQFGMQRWREPFILGLAVFGALGSPLAADEYLLHEHWGGMWCDAEKRLDTPEDDNLCWAAAAADVLWWTGWGQVPGQGFTREDDVLAYFRDHWTNEGGRGNYAWEWWFNGVNPSQGWTGVSQVDLPGGAFWEPPYTFDAVFEQSTDDGTAMQKIDEYLRAGRGVDLALTRIWGHEVACWGFTTDEFGGYSGIYLTDPDDDKDLPDPPDRLRYYEVELRSGHWHLLDYDDCDEWSINTVRSLATFPGVRRTPGDANLDGAVTDADYTIWADHYGQAQATWTMGDFNGDCLVSDADYTIWADHCGVGLPGIPDASSLTLVLVGGLFLRKRRT